MSPATTTGWIGPLRRRSRWVEIGSTRIGVRFMTSSIRLCGRRHPARHGAVAHERFGAMPNCPCLLAMRAGR